MTLYFVISLQRKRLSIAVELVANPAIIFMDEPTSGLDGHAAAVVMRCVRAVANMQRTIICTIHQPSAEIFSSFDMLVLLQTGGHTMYCGPLGKPQSQPLEKAPAQSLSSCGMLSTPLPAGHQEADLVAYFRSAGVRPIQARSLSHSFAIKLFDLQLLLPMLALCLLLRMQPGENAANWMLDVCGGSATGDYVGTDFVALYRDSKLAASNAAAIIEACVPFGNAPSAGSGAYAATYWVQLCSLLVRELRHYRRMPLYDGIRFINGIVYALVIGSLFYQKGQVGQSPCAPLAAS